MRIINLWLVLLFFVSLAVPLVTHAEISTLLETKENSKRKKSSPFRPQVEWTTRSLASLSEDPEADDVNMENAIGLRFRVAKRHKVSFRMSYLNTIQSDPTPEHKNKGEMGDALIRWVDSSNREIFDGVDLIFTHKFYIPVRDRSIERGEITHYKLWALLSKRLTPKWTLVANAIPTAYAFRNSSFNDKASEKERANALYDIYLSAQALYSVDKNWFISIESGWARREYLRFKGRTVRDDSLPVTISANYIMSDDVDIAIGLLSEVPAGELKFNHMRPFPSDYSSLFLEMNVGLF